MLDAHLSYHLNAGVDFVIAAAQERRIHEAMELLEPHIRDGHARVVHSEVGWLNTISAHGWQASP